MKKLLALLLLSCAMAFGQEWTPTATTAWYKADAITGLSDGDSVSAWADQSGNGYDLAAYGTPPVYKAGTLNSLPVVWFSANQMRSPAFTGSQPMTVFLVGMTTTTGLSWIADGLSETTRVVGSMSATTFGVYAGVWIQQTIAAMSNYAIMGGVFNGASSVSSYNGTAVSGNAGTGSVTGLSLGAPDAPLNGPVAEVLVFNSALSTTLRQCTEGYLAWKWGLQTNLPSGHPYRSTAPTVSSCSGSHPTTTMVRRSGSANWTGW
jgi:hypothetical protein